jgi:hypothetical protein
MQTCIAAALLALAGTPALADPIEMETPVSASQNWSVFTGETVPRGQRAATVEAGWPGVSLGYKMGLSGASDIGASFDLLYGFESTSSSQFGLGLRFPYRVVFMRNGPISVLGHIDPGMKLYTTSSAIWQIQAPVGAQVGYAVSSVLRVEAGVEVPVALSVTPSANLFVPPLFGLGAEYRFDRELTFGVEGRLGPVFQTSGQSTQFGFQILGSAAYHM